MDFGCCGLPWITAYLEDAGYNVVGIDVPKPRWRDYSLNPKLNIDLVEYDGHNVPLSDGCASLVLMFGVLEHVGVWKDSGKKYAEPNEQIQTHRREVLEEISRITGQDGSLLVTKFPNKHGLDKLYLPDGGHLNSERTTESKLRDLLSNSFTVESVFQTGFIPYRLPWDAPTNTVARVFAQVDGTLSSTYPFSAVAQSYGAVATPKS